MDQGNSVTRKRVCIIAFKPVRQCIHVLRQIEYLSGPFVLDVIGYGEPDPGWPAVRWRAVPEPTKVAKLLRGLWYVAGRGFPIVYDGWFWTAARHRRAYEFAVASGAAAFHANDWQSLPIAVRAARRSNARVIFHTHEYAEEERSDSFVWRALAAPAIRYLVRKYTSLPDVPIDACITVCEPIAARYRHELGIEVEVVLNAPAPVAAVERPERSAEGIVRLIHHGYAKRGRGLHKLVEALALADRRFELDFMLVEDDPGYVDELQRLALRLAPGRVRFRPPVPPSEIVRTVSEYDLGFCVIEPTTYNNLMMLPNKLFEYVQAGLALCVGPSPAMVDVVQQHGVGVVAPSFEPRDVAETLNRLTASQIAGMQRAARRAAAVLNADVEMGKVIALYDRLLRGGAKVVAG